MEPLSQTLPLQPLGWLWCLCPDHFTPRTANWYTLWSIHGPENLLSTTETFNHDVSLGPFPFKDSLLVCAAPQWALVGLCALHMAIPNAWKGRDMLGHVPSILSIYFLLFYIHIYIYIFSLFGIYLRCRWHSGRLHLKWLQSGIAV